MNHGEPSVLLLLRVRSVYLGMPVREPQGAYLTKVFFFSAVYDSEGKADLNQGLLESEQKVGGTILFSEIVKFQLCILI